MFFNGFSKVNYALLNPYILIKYETIYPEKINEDQFLLYQNNSFLNQDELS